MKNVSGFIALLVFLVLGAILLALASCSKEYIQNPTCFKYIELIDRFDSEIRYQKTDTVYPSGQFGEACNEDTMIFHRKLDTLGCPSGYFSYRYIKK